MQLGRRLATAISAAAAFLPALLWLWPGLSRGLAPTFRDQADFFYPMKLYTAARLRAGELPLWNPLSGTGEPWLANAQSGVLYPPTLLFLLPSVALGGTLFLLVHYALGALGARRFLKNENVSDAGAALGAAAFAASGFAASLSVYWNHFGAWAWVPAIAAVARGGLPRRSDTLALAVLVGLQAMAGSPEMTLATLALAAVLAERPRPEFPEPPAPLPSGVRRRRLAGGLVLGLALAGWALVPLGELGLHSDRRHPLPAAERELGAVGGRDLAAVGGFTPPSFGGAYLATVFLPPFVLVAAAAAFSEAARRPLARVLGLFAVLGIVLAAAGPPGAWIRALPPFDRFRYPAKALVWTSFGAAMLAGLGLDALRFGAARGRARAGLGLAAVAALALAAGAPLPPNVRLACAVGAASVGLLALGLGRRVAIGAALGAIAAAALVAALALGLAGLPAFAPESALVRCPDAVTAFAAGGGRVATPRPEALWGWALRDGSFDAAFLARQREALIGYTNLTCGVATVRTAAPLPTAAAAAMASALGSGESARPAGAAGARALWTPFPPERLPSRRVDGFFRAPVAPYLPRLSWVRGYVVDADADRAWARVASGDVDVTRAAVLDRRPVPDPGVSTGAPMLLARLAEDRPERVVAEVTANEGGLLVLADLFYPGWIAEENGRRLPVLRANGYFRAVALPAGTHRVVFRYRPLSVFAGLGVSLAALGTLAALAYAGEPAVRRRSA